MDWNILYYLLYGFVGGLSELLPVSPAAHGYLVNALTQFPSMEPALMLAIHFAAFLALVINCGHRIGHIYREVKINALPAKDQKRQPDTIAVLDAKVIKTAMLPLVAGILCSVAAYQKLAVLPLLSLLLLLGGIILYIPQFLPGANKDSRSLNHIDSFLLGLASAMGVIPGFSRVGTMISVGMMKGCDRNYILDIALLISVPALLGLMIVDGVMIFAGGTVIVGMMLIYCLLAAVTAFAGAWLAIVIMRYLTVKSNIYGFAYYNWGLCMFSFLLYLMI